MKSAGADRALRRAQAGSPRGRICATYRAAAACGTILAVSANSNTFRSKHWLTRRPGHLWLQMYPFRDKELTKDWLERAKENGYKAVIVTLDSQWPPKRERNIRNKYRRTRGVNYSGSSEHGDAPRPGGSGAGSDPAATWEDLEWINSATDLPVVAKGIMTGENVQSLRGCRRRCRDRFPIMAAGTSITP